MKKWLCLLLSLSLIFATALPVFAEDTIHVVLKGQELVFPDTQPQLVNDRTMVPMRFIFEALGANIYWEDATQTVFAFAGDVNVIMQIDLPTLFVNDKPIQLDVAPQLIGERTMVPLRAVSESFGLNVEWNDETSTVIITE
ncbi:MAG: copper amine oxidase N-terminal domain-containing protein [Clostridia bacterium]|nr:copper amine oxidase N-terminal domain-containing protein [Clostridia bacterium]